MDYVFYSIMFLGMGVGMYLSQDLGYPPGGHDSNAYDEEEGSHAYQDFDDTQEPQSLDDCYTEKISCTKAMDFRLPKPICVYKKKMGLTNYLGLCEIALQNCINRQQKQNGSTDVDEIYHNGKTFDCHYYVNNAKSEEQAVEWYFKLGGRDAQNESITASIDNKI